MENTDFVIEHIDKEVKVITDRPSSVVNYPANTDFFIENIDDNVISIAHSLNIEASEVEFRPANTDFFIENIDNNVIKIAESLELEPSEVTIRPANTDFFVENIDKNLIAIAEYYDLEPSRVVLRPANTDMFIENIDRNVTLIKSRTNVITKSGSFINVDVPDGGTMQLTAINGNATQDGTPTPDAPVSISTVTGEQVVKVEGKNLFSGNYSQFDNQGGTGTLYNYFKLPSDGAYTLKLIAKNDIPLQNPQKFIGFSRQGGESAASVLWAWSGSSTATTGQEFTITNDVYSTYRMVSMYPKNQATLDWFMENFDIQLELGSTATTYEPYQGQEFEVNLGSLELAKIGTYQDRIYKDEDKWYIEKQVGKVVLDGTETGWFYSAEHTRIATLKTNIGDMVQPETGDTIIEAISTHFTPKTEGQFFASGADGVMCITGGGYFNLRDSAWSSLADGTSWLANNKPALYYALATPTTTEITDEALLEQLNFVADMYEGINNISFIGTGAQGTIDIVINKN